MFTKAGFNPRATKSGVRALIHRPGFGNWRPAELITFSCGDLAWWGGGRRLSWGTEDGFTFRNLIQTPLYIDEVYRGDLPQEPVP